MKESSASGLLPSALFGAALVGLAAGGLLRLLDERAWADWIWAGTTAAVLVPTLTSSIRGLLRHEAGVDVIAVLAMGGALLLREYLAGAIIALMLSGGTTLERFAAARARRELTALLERAPRTARRRVNHEVVTVDISDVDVGDVLLVNSGEVIPADGVLSTSSAVLDESVLSGESRPVRLEEGAFVRSGGTNAGGPFEIRVTAPVDESTYSGIIRLVRAAEQSKAPFVRLADRYALVFLGLSLALAGIAAAISADPIRALAVLVVATPCPLILAAPSAIVGGVSRAARHGIIVKGGGPLETLARVSILLLDKTGTVTAGRPQIVAVESFGALGADELVRLSASVEQVSVHPFAPAIVMEARSRNLELRFPSDAGEDMGAGIRARVDGKRVAIGQLDWIAPGTPRTPSIRSVELRTAVEGSSSVYVSVDGRLEGALILHDPVRAEAPRILRDLRALGITRIHMVTGDHPDVAEMVGDAVGIDRVFSERAPAEKVDVVTRLRPDGVTAMVGDGVNDAPALALADVGVAIGARGATAASEAADVVLTTDRLEGLLLAVRIAQRTRRIALESVLVGMGLSLAAMGVAALGYLPPVSGALLQEGIDVLVILNALRALGGRGLPRRQKPEVLALARELAHAHRSLRPHVGELAALAARLEALSPSAALEQLVRIRDMLAQELLPHEREEQRSAFPILGQLLPGEDPTGPLIRTHQEIHRLARLYGRLVEHLPRTGPGPGDLRDLQRALYGLHAILSLHFAQEEELYSLLDP